MKGPFRCVARMSSGRDLVEEFIGYGVWPLAHGWALGEVCPLQMPSLGEQLVRSPAFALDLCGRFPPQSCVRRKTRLCGLWGVMWRGRRPCGVGIFVDPTFA
jgi:hypothetical protein